MKSNKTTVKKNAAVEAVEALEKIRRAVQSRHGGFESASDVEIMAFWWTVPLARRLELLAEKQAEKQDEKPTEKPAIEPGPVPDDAPEPTPTKAAADDGPGKRSHDADSPESQ